MCTTKPGGQGLFQHQLNDLFGTFQRKKKSADTFPLSKSQEKHDKICRGGSLSENIPGKRDSQEDFLRALF